MNVGQGGPHPRSHSYSESSPPHPYSQPSGTRHGHPVSAPYGSPYRSSQNPYPDSREYEADRRWDTAQDTTRPRGQYTPKDSHQPPAPTAHGSHPPSTPVTPKPAGGEYGGGRYPHDSALPPPREPPALPACDATGSTEQRNLSIGSTTSGSGTNDVSSEQMDAVAGSTATTNEYSIHREEVTNMGCTCKKSKCLKLYCQCFAASITCGQNCRCLECQNTPNHEAARKAAIRGILQRNPQAFETKFKATSNSTKPVTTNKGSGSGSLAHKSGCKCRKSACLKKYCECYHAGVKCNVNCRCVGCQNMPKGGFDPRGRESGNFPLTAQSFAADVYSVKHGYEYNKYDDPSGYSSSSTATNNKKKNEPWMMDAAQNLTFLKNAAPHPTTTQRENNNRNEILQGTPSSVPSLASTDEAFPVNDKSSNVLKDKHRNEYSFNESVTENTTKTGDVGISPGTEKSAGNAVNALLMAAYAMTELTNGDSGATTVSSSSPPATPNKNKEKENNYHHNYHHQQLQTITPPQRERTDTETVKYQPSPPKRKSDSTNTNEDYNGSPTKSRRQLVYHQQDTTSDYYSHHDETSTTKTRPQISSGTIFIGGKNTKQALTSDAKTTSSSVKDAAALVQVENATKENQSHTSTTNNEVSLPAMVNDGDCNVSWKNDGVMKSKKSNIITTTAIPVAIEKQRQKSKNTAVAATTSSPSASATATAATSGLSKVGIVTPVTARCIALERMTMNSEGRGRVVGSSSHRQHHLGGEGRQLGLDLQNEQDDTTTSDHPSKSPKAPDEKETMELVATS